MTATHKGMPLAASTVQNRDVTGTLADAKKWTNKQRVLLLASRGIGAAHRHLLDDFKKLLPHHKSESKWEKKAPLEDINEVAELNSCNNVMYFEARRKEECYLWLAKTPNGPSIKFQVLNVHTLGSMNLVGNCLLYSRPLLTFDKNFASEPSLCLLREMITQIFGTPRFHPKSKPFYDHVMSFFLHDGKIWFRHYQIFSEKNDESIDTQTLREIGPRFVLEPIRMFQGTFGGKTLWKNPKYVTPSAMRARLHAEGRKKRAQKYFKKQN